VSPNVPFGQYVQSTRYFADENISSFSNLTENQWLARGIKCADINLCSELLSHEGLFQINWKPEGKVRNISEKEI
jgi:hypothetical protein